MTFFRRTAEFRRFFVSLPIIINLLDTSFLAKSCFRSAYTNLIFFLLFPQSRLLNSRSYQLLIIVRLKGGSFLFVVLEVLPCSGCFITCMGARFPTIQLDNAIRFSTLSRISGFLWHSSKWAHWFGRFFQYTSGIEVLAYSLNTDLNYMTTMPQLHPSLNR